MSRYSIRSMLIYIQHSWAINEALFIGERSDSL